MEIYLNFVDQSAAALDFYGKVFKTTTDEIMYYRDAPTDPEHPLPEQLKDLVMHASIMIDGTQVMISDVPPEMGLELTSGNNIALVIQAKSDAEIEQLYHDLSSDGKIVAPLEATFWAKKYAIVNDKFGIQWQLNLPLIYSQRYAKYPSNTCITRLMGILYFHLLSTQKEPQLWYS